MDEFDDTPVDKRQFAKNLVDIDKMHGATRKTGAPIEEYADAFDVDKEDLLRGTVLNIGDPLLALAAEHPNVVALDYYFGLDAEKEIEYWKNKRAIDGLTETEEKHLEIIKNWLTVT